MLFHILPIGRLSVVAGFVLLFCQSQAQTPKLGWNRKKVEESLRLACRNQNDHEAKYYKDAEPATLVEIADTMTYRVSSDFVEQFKYVFSNDTCVGVSVKFSCLCYLRRGFKRWFLRGRWRVDENRYYYRFKNPARASITRVNDYQFLYELEVVRLDSPPSNEAFKGMRKVKRKHMGSRDYPLRRE